ncbi:isoprenoid synthase domain-containing protein [Mycena olivaceomarginata]|nr:isoprenoid synthase domain-containing protein [Mycena olivaceomarginata]
MNALWFFNFYRPTDNLGCKPCWRSSRYALDIDLPDFVFDDPVIMALNQSTNDLVTWSNDIFSYNVEQSRGDTHNMITILTKYHGHSLQSAVDYVGELCRLTIDTFQRDRASIPLTGDPRSKPWSSVISLHWSFMTERYFGKSAADVKKKRFVALPS